MASNIRVTLEIDNKKYLSGIKASEAATKTFATSAEKSVSQANNAFAKINNTTDGIVKRFSGLRSAIAGLAFGAMGKSALAMADELQDLSNSSGIAVGRLLELKKALETSGGEAAAMPAAINQFARSIDEAAQGSAAAQYSFAQVGISLRDLGKLSEQDLLKKTLKGIAAIEDPSRRAALMMDKFGKSFKTVDPGELLAKLEGAAGSGDKYAASIKRAAELNDAFATASGNLRLAFLEAFSPAITLINDFNAKVAEGTASMDGLVTAIKIAGALLITAFSASLILPAVAAFGSLGRAVGITAGAAGFAGLSKSMASTFRVLGPLNSSLRAIGLLFAGGLGLAAAGQLFDDFGSMAVNALARIIEMIGSIIFSLSGGALGAALGSALGPVGTILGGLAGAYAGDKLSDAVGMPKLIENAQRAREEAEKLAKSTRDAAAARKKFAESDPRRTDAPSTAPTGRPVTDALARQRDAIRENILEFRKLTSEKINDINTDNMLIGKSADFAEVIRAQEEIYKRAADKCDELRRAKSNLTDQEGALSGEYDKQIALIAKQAEVDGERVKRSIENSQGLRAIEADRIAGLERMTHAMDEQAKRSDALAQAQLGLRAAMEDVNFAGAQAGKSPFAQQAAQIVEDARKAALEAGRAFAAAFEDTGDGLTPARAQELSDGLKAISDGYKGITDAQQVNLEASRTWSAGWDKAFGEYKDSAQNAAEQSTTYFNTFTSGFEDAIVNFVKTGKLSFKDLANSLIADFARIQAKKLLLGLMDLGGGGGSGGILSTIFGGGRANGGAVGVGGAYMVGERGPEMFVPRNAGTIVPNSSMGGNNITQVTYNIQAADAASFRQMIARDPEFLYAVTERGRNNVPSGRR